MKYCYLVIFYITVLVKKKKNVSKSNIKNDWINRIFVNILKLIFWTTSVINLKTEKVTGIWRITKGKLSIFQNYTFRKQDSEKQHAALPHQMVSRGLCVIYSLSVESSWFVMGLPGFKFLFFSTRLKIILHFSLFFWRWGSRKPNRCFISLLILDKFLKNKNLEKFLTISLINNFFS